MPRASYADYTLELHVPRVNGQIINLTVPLRYAEYEVVKEMFDYFAATGIYVKLSKQKQVEVQEHTMFVADSAEDIQDMHRELSQEAGGTYYGDGGTIHSSGHLDIEVDKDGTPTAVWFRCRTLPFKIYRRDEEPCFDNPADITIRGIDFVIT